MKYLNTLWILTVALLALGADGDEDWAPFDSEDGRFSVKMPGEPENFTLDVPTPAGAVETHFYMLESHEGEVAHIVAYNDYPKTVDTSDPQTVLENVRDGACAASNMEVQSDKELEVEGGAGLSFTATGQGMVLYSQVYLYGHRLYQVMVVTSEELDDAESRQQFFGSFQVTEE